MGKLIILRGNIGSGKTSTAKLLQDKFGDSTFLISQNIIQRELLNSRSDETDKTLPLIRNLLKYGSESFEYTIIEGRFFSKDYRTLFEYAKEIFIEVFPFYWDLPIKETVRRYMSEHGSCNEEMIDSWWREKDFIDILNEYKIYKNLSLEKTVDLIHYRVMNSEYLRKTEDESRDDVIFEYVNHMYNGNFPNINDSNFSAVYKANAYAATALSILKRCPMNVELSVMMARLYLMCKPKPVAAIFVLDRRNRVKYIMNIARNYRAILSEFEAEIYGTCTRNRSKSCIVVYNYDYVRPFNTELRDLSRLFLGLEKKGITLKDAIKIVNGNAIPIISTHSKVKY